MDGAAPRAVPQGGLPHPGGFFARCTQPPAPGPVGWRRAAWGCESLGADLALLGNGDKHSYPHTVTGEGMLLFCSGLILFLCYGFLVKTEKRRVFFSCADAFDLGFWVFDSEQCCHPIKHYL